MSDAKEVKIKQTNVVGVFEITRRLDIYTSQGVVEAEPGDLLVATKGNVTVYQGVK